MGVHHTAIVVARSARHPTELDHAVDALGFGSEVILLKDPAADRFEHFFRFGPGKFRDVTRDADEILVTGGFHFLQPLVLVVEFGVVGGHDLVTVIGEGLGGYQSPSVRR